MKSIKTFLIVAFCVLTVVPVDAQNKHTLPYKNSTLPTSVRVSDLLSRMTLEEKVSQMNMLSLNKLKLEDSGQVNEDSIEALFKGRSIGTLESPFIGVDEISRLSEAADNYLRTKTRLGIPAIQIAECLHGQLAFGATIFPQTIAQGSTWNPDLIERMASVIAHEASLSGVDQALSPIFDLARDPRYGRYEESFSEDPYLVAEMGKAFVLGLQGHPSVTKQKIPDNKLISTAKHYVAYSSPIAGINLGPNNLGPRDLRELHIYPFKKVIQEANIYSVMPAYNEVNGIPLHSNQYLMKDILRDELGFKGYVFSDYEAIAMLNYFHKVTEDKAATAISALNAGVDLEAPSSFAYSELPDLVRAGKVDVALIDNAVTNILTAKFKAGLFDNPYKAPKKVSDLIHTDKSVKLARQVAEEAIILMKNENNQLPLDISKLNSIAVIGPNADQVQYGDYSATKDNDSGVTILEGIRKLTKGKVIVNYAKGSAITGNDKSSIPNAVEAAKKSDVVVLVIGGTSSTLSGIGWGKEIPNDFPTSGEGFDRTSLDPPGVQSELIRAVHKTGKPIVLVLVHGRSYSIPWEKEHIPAIVEAWYPGEEGGNAVARVLFGDVNPSGKLTVSVPKSAGHVPVFYNYKPSGRGFYKKPGSPQQPGRDYVFSSPDPLFSFGHGLSYTTFTYSNLQVEDTKLDMNGDVKLSVKVTNTGKIAGKEVVQVYINDKFSTVTTPVKALKEFKKVEITPNQTVSINFSIPVAEFGLWDKDMKYVVEPGAFEIMIGSSAEDIRLRKTITIK